MALKLQPIPYQGSKRLLAERILSHAPLKFKRLIEPFAGSAAVSLFAASQNLTSSFVINDSYEPLIRLWELIIDRPDFISNEYEKVWNKQLTTNSDYYYDIRMKYNSNQDPVLLLYLSARCVKNAIRFNSRGEFNQSPDKRRLGRNPVKMREQLMETSFLLKNKVRLLSQDYELILDDVTKDDLVYMDPPYQGTSGGKNPRYHQGIDFERFVSVLRKLNTRGINYLISFDGMLGSKIYGKPLPAELDLKQRYLHAGRSTQSTLIGKSEVTLESLYISSNLPEDVRYGLFNQF